MDPFFTFQDEIMQLEVMDFLSLSPDPFAILPVAVKTDIQSPPASVMPVEKEIARCVAPCFVEYSRSMDENVRRSLELKSSEQKNVHRRVIEYLRKSPKPNKSEADEKINKKNSQLFQHMMKERLRRENISQCYADLHTVILPRPKANKNSIIQSAAAYLKELKIIKAELHRKNKNLRERLDTENILQSKGLDLRIEHMIKGNNMKIEDAKFEVRLMNPVSTIDSMIEALQCLKGMGVLAMSIQSKFSEDESTTMMIINTKFDEDYQRLIEAKNGMIIESQDWTCGEDA